MGSLLSNDNHYNNYNVRWLPCIAEPERSVQHQQVHTGAAWRHVRLICECCVRDDAPLDVLVGKAAVQSRGVTGAVVGRFVANSSRPWADPARVVCCPTRALRDDERY